MPITKHEWMYKGCTLGSLVVTKITPRYIHAQCSTCGGMHTVTASGLKSISVAKCSDCDWDSVSAQLVTDISIDRSGTKYTIYNANGNMEHVEEGEMFDWCISQYSRKNQLRQLASKIAQRNNQEHRTVYLHYNDYPGKPSPEALREATERLNEMGVVRYNDETIIDSEAIEKATVAYNEEIINKNRPTFKKTADKSGENDFIKEMMKNKRTRDSHKIIKQSFGNGEPIGVYRKGNKYAVRIKRNKINHYGGSYSTIAEAEAASIRLQEFLLWQEAKNGEQE